MATRALLDLSLAVRPDGAAQAGWLSGSEYEYAWPRDSSWVAVALTDAGHPAMAYRILEFLHRMQGRNGIWAARYAPDGSGPVRDGRPAELDADGWVPWAVWSWAVTQPLTSQSHHELTRLWPMVVRAADAAVRSLTDDGLSGPAMDYWEDSVEVTLGTAAPLLAGLRAAADLAPDVGSATATSDGHRWAAAAARLATAITATFGRNGYQRTPAAGSGADAAVTFLGPPFAVPSAAVLQAARSAQRALTVPNGGLRPGTSWPGTPDVAWTPETAFFALFDASTGQHGQAAALLAWLAAHRTRLGSLPEQVNSSGQPASVAPLAWTDAVTLLALLAQAGHLPTIPVPSPGQ
jgi:GH15 family glucan-1,4-alpha-glucosidase